MFLVILISSKTSLCWSHFDHFSL